MSHSMDRISEVRVSPGGERVFTASCSCGASLQNADDFVLAQQMEAHCEPKRGTERDLKGRAPKNGAEA